MSATEQSPLLSRTSSRASYSQPTVAEALRRARTADYRLLYIEDVCPPDLLDRDDNAAERNAFTLIVLLKLRQSRLRALASPLDIWEHWSQQNSARDDVQILEERINSIWSSFLAEYRSYQELEHVLWEPFPIDETSSRMLRVVDFLRDKDSPPDLLCNSAVLRSLGSLWRHGFYDALSESMASRMLHRWDNMTPRASHLLALLSQLAYFGLLVWFLIVPPPLSAHNSRQYPGPREIVIIILSFANILRPSLFILPDIIILVSFLASLPWAVYPTSIAFPFCQVAFLLLFVQLHLPHYPSPLFLFPKNSSLPLAMFLARGFTHVTLPVLAFFLPALIIAGALLSVSLKDNPMVVLAIGPPDMTPMITLQVLLFLGICIILCLVCSLVLVGASTAVQCRNRRDWDRFSPSIGIDARALFVRATAHYSEPYVFPPPLNIIELPFRLFRLVFGHRRWVESVEIFLWRILVGPLNVLIRCLLWLFSRDGLLQSLGI